MHTQQSQIDPQSWDTSKYTSAVRVDVLATIKVIAQCNGSLSILTFVGVMFALGARFGLFLSRPVGRGG
jgi:hypothetical protein